MGEGYSGHAASATSILSSEGSKIPLEETKSPFETFVHKDYPNLDALGGYRGGDYLDEDLRGDHVSGSKRGEEEYSFYSSDLKARATVKFHKMTFCKEFFYHNFFPLSIPFMYYLDGGWYSLVNRGFMGWDNIYLMASQWFFSSNFYLLNIASLRYVTEAKDFGFLYDVLLVDLLWAMRNLVVATKYAFLSQVEMWEMRTKKVPTHVHDYRALLAAWRDPIPRRVVNYELILAAQRNKLVLTKYTFLLDPDVDSDNAIRDLILDLQLAKNDLNRFIVRFGKPAERWLEMATEEVIQDPVSWAEGGGMFNVGFLPVRLYAAHVICQSSSLSRLKRLGHTLLSRHLRKCATLLGTTHAILLVGIRLLFGGHPVPGPEWTTFCTLIASFILVTYAMISNVSFMMIGVLDFRRRHYILQSLDEVLRTSVYMSTPHVRNASLRVQSSWKRKLFPDWLRSRGPNIDESRSGRSVSSGALSGSGVFFDFTNPDSLLAWWACRQLLSNFGHGFYMRIKYYTIYFAGYCVVLLMFLVLKMLSGVKRLDFNILISVIFSINVFVTLLALMVWPGGDANHLLNVHGITLVHRKMRTQMTMIKEGKTLRPEEELKKSIATAEIINSIADAVKWHNGKAKLSVCGFDASNQLISLIVAVVTGSISIGIGQIIQNGVKL